MRYLYTFYGILCSLAAISQSVTPPPTDTLAKGLNIQPAKTTTTIRLRCHAISSSAHFPLVVVDHTIVDSAYLRSLDPQCIASIDILKGTKATAIWGAAAEHGVLSITTTSNKLATVVLQEKKEAVKNTPLNTCWTTNDPASVYPNPVKATGTITLLLNHESSYPAQLQIIDLHGTIVGTSKLQMVAGENRITIPMGSRWYPGLYFVRLTNEKGIVTQVEKFFIQ